MWHKKQNTEKTNQQGQGLAEYGLVILIVGIAAILAVFLFQDELENTFEGFIGTANLAPPSLGPIGGNFATRPPTPLPPDSPPTIRLFSTTPNSPIQIPVDGDVNLTFLFDADDERGISLYEIDYTNDGSVDDNWTSESFEPSYTYSQGVYEARLIVTDTSGQTSEAITTIVVYDNTNQIPDLPPEITSISAVPIEGEAPLEVTFDSVVNPDHDSTITTYRWVMGNGFVDTISGATAVYSYTTPGTYEVFLQVEDDEGYTADSQTITINVLDAPPTPTPPPTSTPTPTPEPCAFGPYTFPGQIEMENFRCGGQGVAYNENSSGTNAGGAYRPDEGVDLYDASSDPSGGNYFVGETRVGEWMEYDINVSNSGTYDALLRYRTNSNDSAFRLSTAAGQPLNTTALPNTSGNWQDFIIQDMYLPAGSQILRFNVEGGFADLNYFIVATDGNLQPYNTPPTAAFNANPDSGNLQNVTFDGSVSTDDESIATYEWWFGDGATATESANSVAHTYAQPGTYTVRLTVTDNEGATDFTERQIQVTNQLASCEYLETNNQISIEAEDFYTRSAGSNGDAWELTTDFSGYVGTAAIIAAPNDNSFEGGSNGPTANYQILFNNPDTYYVYLRVRNDNSNGDSGNNDSAHIAFNGTRINARNDMTAADEFLWYRFGDSIEVDSAAVHTLGLLMREDGLVVDRLVMSTNPSLISNGSNQNGPGESTQGTCPDRTPPPPPPPDDILYVADTGLNASDQTVVARLEGMGYTVEVIDDGDVAASDGNNRQLIIVSSTVASGDVGDIFETAAVPVMVWEQALYDDMNMSTSSSDVGTNGSVRVVNPFHPLSAGYLTTELSSAGSVASSNVNNLGSGALIIAQAPNNATRATYFAYEQGGTLTDGSNAAHRRVGYPMTNNSADNWTAAGRAMFDTAVDWAINGGNTTPLPVGGNVVFSDNFNRADNTNIGSWDESEQGGTEVEIVNNQLCFTDTGDRSFSPVAENTFTGISSNYLLFEFDLNWDRVAPDNDYEVHIQLGDSNQTANNNDFEGIGVNYVWTILAGQDERLGHRSAGGAINPILGTVVDNSTTVRVLVDVTNGRYTTFVDGSQYLTVDFQDSAATTIDTIRFATESVNTGSFNPACFDNVRISD